MTCIKYLIFIHITSPFLVATDGGRAATKSSFACIFVLYSPSSRSATLIPQFEPISLIIVAGCVDFDKGFQCQNTQVHTAQMLPVHWDFKIVCPAR